MKEMKEMKETGLILKAPLVRAIDFKVLSTTGRAA